MFALRQVIVKRYDRCKECAKKAGVIESAVFAMRAHKSDVIVQLREVGLYT